MNGPRGVPRRRLRRLTDVDGHRERGRFVPRVVRRDPRQAVVLSSGGANGAYAVGVLRAILTGTAGSTDGPVEPTVYSGSSVGAYSAALLCSRPESSPLAALDRLERVWRREIASSSLRCGNGVYRLRGLPVQELDVACLTRPLSAFFELADDVAELSSAGLYRAGRFAVSDLPLPARLIEAVDVAAFFDSSPLHRLVERTVDLSGFARTGHTLAIVASRWDTGRPRVFGVEDLTGRFGHRPLLASMAIPGVFPPVEVEGAPYVDGALTMNTPLRPAIRAGADVLHAIYLDPLISDSPVPASSNTFDVATRVFSLLSAHRMNNDIRYARSVNGGLALLAGLADRRPDDDTGALASLGRIRENLERRRQGQPRRWLTIHRYRPHGDLGTGAEMLNFDITHVDRLIERGYADAVTHDCATAGCVLPELGGGRARRRDDDRRSGGELRSERTRTW